MTVEGKKAVLAVAAIVLCVTGVFIGLTLANLDRIRTSVAIRRAAVPVLKTPTGEMVIVPEGEFQVPEWEKPPSLKAFYIDKDPVSPESYGRFLRETGRKDEDVSAEIAEEFCRWARKRLPSREELAKARRGATLEDDVSIYGVRGLARGAGFRCALDAAEAGKFR